MRASWPAPTTPPIPASRLDSINTTVTISSSEEVPWTSPSEWTSTDHSRRRSSAPRGCANGASLVCGPRRSSDRTRSPSLPWSDASTGPRPRYRRRADPNASPDDAGGPSAHRARGHRRSTLAGHRPLAQGVVEACGASRSITRRTTWGVPRSPRADAAWRTRQRPRGASERVTIGALGPGTCELRRSWWRPCAENAGDGRT